MIKIIVILLFSLISLQGEIIIKPEDKSINNFTLKYYFDKSNKLTIHDITKINFTKKINNKFSLGYLKGTSWLKFSLTNTSKNEDFVFYLNEALYETVLFYDNKEYQWKEKTNGNSIPLLQRDIPDPNMAFKFTLKKGESKTFYIKLVSKLTSFGSFSIYRYDTFINEYRTLPQMLYMFYFGILTFIVLFNFFIYLKLKESIYIYYVGYISFFNLFIIYFSGLHIYLGIENWYYQLHIAAPLFIIFLLLFSKKFLEISKYTPKLSIYFKSLNFILLILAILIFLNIEPWYQIMNIFATFAFILLIYTSIITWNKGNKKSKYYLFAISIYMITIILMSSLANGWIEYNYINRYAFLFGSCFEIIFFTLILANRYDEIQQEKLKIQDSLLVIKSKNELILKQEVRNQTKEIQKINQVLSNQLKENKLLLKELYHRVKNNFQLIISLLWIESNKIKNKSVENSFNNLIGRIKSMSAIHNILYNSEIKNENEIDSKEYILDIVNEIIILYSTKEIKINSNINKIFLEINDAIVLGIVINEVITNSIKHHKFQIPCEISISLIEHNGQYNLTIKDNGEGFEETKTTGMGLELIKQFSKQLQNSKINYTNYTGTTFLLSFNPNIKSL